MDVLSVSDGTSVYGKYALLNIDVWMSYIERDNK